MIYNLLPLKKEIRSVAVIGPNADNGLNQLGDYTAKVVTARIFPLFLGGIKKKYRDGQGSIM
jgi:beta-glucosidase